MSTKGGLIKKLFGCVLFALAIAMVFTGCELQDPVTESVYYINDNDNNYYNKDHTTSEEAVDEFTDSITALRTYLDSESFVDSGYYMGVDFDIDILDADNNTEGNFALRIQSYLYTYPYEDEDGNPIYKYYENGQYYDTNNEEGTRTLVSALEIHNEAIKKSDFSIEWYNGATNEVLIGLYFDGLNSNSDNPGNILYANIQGYKRSFYDFGDTVIFQQLIRLLCSLSVEGLLESLGLQADAGTGSINSTMVALIGENYKRVVNNDIISLLFYSVTLDAISSNVTELLYDLLGVFGRKWDPMTYKFLGFKFSTVADAIIESITGDMQAIVSPDKQHVNNVLTNAVFAFNGVVNSYDVLYTYTSNIRFDYGWVYPETLKLDTFNYKPFDYGNYEFEGTLYIPAWDMQLDALIRTDMQQYDNSTNNVFMEFRDIANGELMIGVYYRHERAYLDISGMEYMYGWIDVESLGFPQVYDEHLDLAHVLGKFFKMINNTIVSIVDSILDPEKSDKENKVLEYIMKKTSYSEKTPDDIFSINSETLQVDIELVKQMLEETGVGTYSTRQIINILDSVSPYTMDQLAIMLGIASAEIMLEKTYFTLTWNVDTQEMTMIMYTNVGVEPGEPSTMIFKLEVLPVYFGEYVKISDIDFSGFKPLGQIYTYSGTLNGDFVFSSQETVDLSKLLSATVGESSGLNTPYILPTNAGVSFTLIYDQFVTDQQVDGAWKLAGRSAFDLTVWLTGSESSIIITLCSDDVCFDNEVYKDLPAREAELGYIWVSIECVTKNGVQAIPKLKIREDVFMASMSAYMNNETSIGDDVSSFADNDFNLSLTSIISALCKDAYVVAEPEQMEITSSNETLQNLFRVSGLIGNIKVDAGFTYRVKGLEDIKDQYYMYEVGFFKDIDDANSPYDTELHKELITYYYEDYRDQYDPLKYDFYVYRNRILLDDNTIIDEGTMMIFELGARKFVTRQPIEYASSSFFNQEDANNQDVTRAMFMLAELPFVHYGEGVYFYFTYYNKYKEIPQEYVYLAPDGTVYIYWLGIRDVLFHEEDDSYYYYDMEMALLDERGDYVYIFTQTDRDLLFEYDIDSITVTEACKTQYAPRTNGSFMGDVRRYFIRFTSVYQAELGALNTIYHDVSSVYPEFYSDADKNHVVEVYDEDGVLISSTPTPITLVVLEPCEDLPTTIEMLVKTKASLDERYTFNAEFLIDWEQVTTKGYMVITEVVVAPGMMGEKSYPIRLIVVNREIDTNERANIFTANTDAYSEGVPVVDSIDVDPYDYVLAKYAYLSDSTNFNPAVCFTQEAVEKAYEEALRNFTHEYFAQKQFAFTIDFKWAESYIYNQNVGELYLQKEYENFVVDTDGNEEFTAYDWNFDLYEFGNNLEKNVSPVGGYLYLHTYFEGQLIALRVNIGARNFSHVKFGENDDFNVRTYNEEKGGDVYINGLYRGNYYDTDSYAINGNPIFVFTDSIGNEYEYVFDMKIITGLKQNSDGSYSGTYEIKDNYSLSWGEEYITYINTTGSYYQEYTYDYLYGEEFVTSTVSYTALTGVQQAQKVRYVDASGNLAVGNLYANDGGYIATRQRISYANLTTILNNNGLSDLLSSYVEASYLTSGKAYLFVEENGGVKVRSDATSAQNRPFYYYAKVGDASKTPILPTNTEEYTKCLEGDPNYVLITENTSQITTTALNLYYLLRIYFVIDGKVLSISAVNNAVIEKEIVGEASRTPFPVVPVRINVECPELTIAYNAEEEDDEIKDETYYPAMVNAGDKNALGYYKVDPLNVDTLYLPDSVEIYFTDDKGRLSSHVFSDLVWGASFNEITGQPIFTCIDKDGIEQTIIVPENVLDKNGNVIDVRYKIAIDIESLTGTLKFGITTKIGNDISGYQYVKISANVLSKDPTDIKFFVQGSSEPIPVRKTVSEINKGIFGNEQITYYTYYANTFTNFNLPTRLTATFSDDHEQTYNVKWRMANGEENFVFAPDSVVNLVTTIGTDTDVTIDVFLSVVSENYTVNEITTINEFMEYYVTVQSTSGEIFPEKVAISELLHYDSEKIGYYRIGTSWYYPRISTGGESDDRVEANCIGLYLYDSATNKYVLTRSVSVYEFITTLYSSATIVLDKHEVNYTKQDILSDNKSIFDYSMSAVDEYGTTSVRSLREMTTISYKHDALSRNDVLNVAFGMTDPVLFTKYYPNVNANGNIVIYGEGGISREISYGELVIHIIAESLAEKYINWKISKVNGLTFNEGKELLSSFVEYGASTGLNYKNTLSFGKESTIELVNPDNETQKVTFGYDELTYRLNYYYGYQRVVDNTRVTVRDKNIEIVDLYKKMDVSDMVYRLGFSESKDYVVRLGTFANSYDLNASLVFTGGFYLTDDSASASTEKVNVYTSLGEAQYAGGYVLGNNVSIEASAIFNDGTNNETKYKYNVSATDEKLVTWYVENSTFEEVEIGSLITAIPASALYRVGAISGGYIEMSTLTEEGFRLRRIFEMEALPEIVTSGYNGSHSGGFDIINGVIKVENVYDYANPSVAEYFGQTSYLPSVIAVTINNKTLTVSNVKWEIDTGWASIVRTLTYNGTYGNRYVMASAQILGYKDAETGKQVNTITIEVKIEIDTAEVILLPWETNSDIELKTQTLYEGGDIIYYVYVDTYLDAEADVITSEDTLTLPTTITARYTSGLTFTFDNVKYTFNNVYNVSKIFFDLEGVNILAMTSTVGDLSGYDSAKLSRRYLDLLVNLGLAQELRVRFYFYDKTPNEVTIGEEKHTDAVAVIKTDDEDLRKGIKDNRNAKFNNYMNEVYEDVNYNRIEYNLKLLIEQAQNVKKENEDILYADIEALDIMNFSAEKAEEALLKWTDVLLEAGESDIAIESLPITYAYSVAQAKKFAIRVVKQQANKISSSTAAAMKNIALGSGSIANKKRNILRLAEEFYETLANNMYDALIGEYLQIEFKKMFSESIEKFTAEEYNNTIYYKNMVEAGFDVDAVVETIYKLRAMKNSGASMDVDLILAQIDLSRGIEKFGLSITGTTEQDYYKLAVAVIANELLNAYDYAVEKAGNLDNDDFNTIKGVVDGIIESRLNIERYVTGISSSASTENYTLTNFVEAYAYNETQVDKVNDVTKKVMRSYLINLMHEVMQFTKLGAQNTAMTVAFNDLQEEIIAYSMTTISNYSTIIRSIRRSLLSQAAISGVLNNFLTSGINNFINTVYAENVYISEINALRESNGILIDANKWKDAEQPVREFAKVVNESSGRYLIEPYYAYNNVPKKIMIFFKDGDAEKGNEGGFGYVTSIEWSEDTISKLVSYKGATGYVYGRIEGSVTGDKQAISMKVDVARHVLEAEEVIITDELILEATEFYNEGGQFKQSENGVYAMVRGIAEVRIYLYDRTRGSDPNEYMRVKRERTINLEYHEYAGATEGTFRPIKVSGYDTDGDVMYVMENEYDGDYVKQQTVFVYNPFQFDANRDLPSQIVIEGKVMDVVWNNFGILPTGNLVTATDKESARITGKVGGASGQSVSMYLFVAQWTYAGMYQKTENTTANTYTVDGEIINFIYMNPLIFYFGRYSQYSSQEYYMLYFKVRTLRYNEYGNLEVATIIFKKDLNNVGVIEMEEGFVKKIFYPSDSRLLEYGTDDNTMYVVKSRSNYLIYWDQTNKNKVINNRLSMQDDCSIFVGNNRVGTISLTSLREKGDNITPVSGYYSYEEMTIDKLRVTGNDTIDVLIDDAGNVTLTCVTSGYSYYISENGKAKCNVCGTEINEPIGGIYELKCPNATCEQRNALIIYDASNEKANCTCSDTCKLYNEIEDTLLANNGQVSIVMSANNYYPTTGLVELFENNVSYKQDDLDIRFVWNQTFSNIIAGLKPFVAYAYPDVEDASRESYSINLLMDWPNKSVYEQQEIIEFAKDYMFALKGYTGVYTDEQCTLDAYNLLAINETYNFANDVEKLKGGANNMVRVTVLARVNGNTIVYQQQMTVKVMFLDYTPIKYLTKGVDGNYYDLQGAVGSNTTITSTNYNKFNNIYIAVRTEYWDVANSVSAYTTTPPYDNLSDVGYKMLQIKSDVTNTTLSGAEIELENIGGKVYKIIPVSGVVWRYDEKTNMLISENFTINGVSYSSNLLQITLNN